MADETPRLGLPIYTSGTDLHPTREDFNDRMQLLEEAVAIARQGTAQDRPMPSTRGTLFMETDTRILWFDTGTEWIRVVRVGHDGPGRGLAIGGSGSEGSSEWAARADHVHPLPLATASQPGAMSATDKALLNTASANATSNSLARRNGSGQMSTAAPSAASHATNRGYVDGQVNPLASLVAGLDEQALRYRGTADGNLNSYTDAGYWTTGAGSQDNKPAGLRGTLLVFPNSVNASGSQIFTTHHSATTYTRSWHEDVGWTSWEQVEHTGHSHSASDVNSGTFELSRIPNLPASRTTSGVFNVARIPNLPASQTTSGTFDATRLPAATQSQQGALSAADKTKLDRATSLSTANRLVERDSGGRASFIDPQESLQAANKRYVDNQVATALTNLGAITGDLNSARTAGFGITGAGSQPNKPLPQRAALVVYTDGARGVQELTSYFDGYKYWRTWHEDVGWTRWQMVVPNETRDAPSSNFNDITRPGRYVIPVINEFSNSPNVGLRGTLTVHTDRNFYVEQILIVYGSGNRYWRVYHFETGWTSWRRDEGVEV